MPVGQQNTSIKTTLYQVDSVCETEEGPNDGGRRATPRLRNFLASSPHTLNPLQLLSHVALAVCCQSLVMFALSLQCFSLLMELAAEWAAGYSLYLRRHAELGKDLGFLFWVSPAYKTKKALQERDADLVSRGSQEYYTGNRHRNDQVPETASAESRGCYARGQPREVLPLG